MHFGMPPLSVIIGWPTPNYVDPEKRSSGEFAIGAIFFALATVVVFLRLYARLFIRRWFGLDDFFICFAWVC
jgi:hypothetical protein